MRIVRALAAVLGLAACGGSEPAGGADGPRPDALAADAAPDGGVDGAGAACTTVLVYNDCDPALDANCASIPEALFSDDAAARLGLTTLYPGVGAQPAFRDLVDAGGFDVIVFESSSAVIEVDTAERLASWVGAGGKLVFSGWDLDEPGGAGPILRAALGVTTTGSFDTPRSVHAAPADGVDFFTGPQPLPSPLGFSNIGIDDGDELALAGAGVLPARFTSPTGPGAIAVTHAGAVVVLGFLPVELVYQLVLDGDEDGIPDVEELYTNVLAYLCAG